MYSEYWIKKYDEAKIYDYLKNNGKIRYASHEENDVNFCIALENYLVKYRNSNDKIINYYIDKIFESFSNNPLLYSYSYILSNELVVNSIINNNEKRKQLYNIGKNKLIKGWETTYNKIMNNEFVDSYNKNKLLVLLTMGIRNGNINDKTIEKFIRKLLNKNKIPNNDFEKLLLFNYASRFTLGNKYNMIDTFIKVGNIVSENNSFTGGYEKNGIIIMNDHPSSYSFYKTLDEMIQCVCHETTHAIQEQQAINDPYNVHAMEMAIQRLFAFEEYQMGENYLFNEIEENAQRNGYYNAEIIYSFAGRNDISMKLLRKKQNYVKGRRFQYENVTINENGQEKVISKEKYNVENIRKIVKKNPNIMEKYPVLKNLFDRDGNYKSLDEMLSEDFKSYDISNMYTDFIIYDIRNNGLNNIDLNNKNNKEKYNILYNLCSTFQIITKKAIDIIKDDKYRELNKERTNYYYKKTLDDIVKMANYIEKELPWMRGYENNHPGNYNLYSKYTISIRQLLNIIERYKLDNQLTNLEETTNKYQSKFDSFDLNIKKEYMNYILEHFTYRERCTLLKINNNFVTLEKYVRTEVLAHMSREHYLFDNKNRIITDEKGSLINPIDFVRNVYEKYKINNLNRMFSDNTSSNNRNVNQVRYR